jgi:hypothetical protein
VIITVTSVSPYCNLERKSLAVGFQNLASFAVRRVLEVLVASRLPTVKTSKEVYLRERRDPQSDPVGSLLDLWWTGILAV